MPVKTARGNTRELYGEWQTQKYQPKAVQNGRIPRNKFGNVELFHPDMLPAGAVHLTCALLTTFTLVD